MRGQVSELRFSSKEWSVPNQILQAFVLSMPSVVGTAALRSPAILRPQVRKMRSLNKI